MILVTFFDNINWYVRKSPFGGYELLVPAWRVDLGYNHAIPHDMNVVRKFNDRLSCDAYILENLV